MAEDRTAVATAPALRRFKLAVQVNRILFYTFSAAVALVYEAVGVFKVGLVPIFGVWSVAVLSAVALYLVYRRWWRLYLEPAWFLLDGALVTFGVYVTGGASSPWLPWYVASMSGAAVAGGFLWAVAMAVMDGTAYLAVVVALGQARLFDEAFYHNLALVVSLFCAPAFFLWGTVELQKKRRIIKQLKEGESLKVRELTRLAQELDAKTRELKDANQRIQEADRLKSQFLANMSHELRTPLNSIIGFSDVLITRLEGELPERYARFLQIINGSGHHLLGIINDLLDLSKIEAGKMEVLPERFSLESLLQGVCTVMKGVADKRGIAFDVRCAPGLPPLEADPVKIKQVFYNLLSNAVKFSPDGAPVTVEAAPLGEAQSPLETPSVEVRVRDRGIGVDPQYHEAIFEEFRQIDSSAARSFGGTGLGLALVKRFVEVHGGTVKLESAPGAGSTFIVTLPLRFRGDRAQPLEAAVVRAEERLQRILVVEDDPTAFESLSRRLAEAGFGAVRARQGGEALKAARELSPAAITLDIVLPDMDGWEVLRRLKDDPETRQIPVIIVSVMDNRELGLALGAVDYFLKPIEGDGFVRRLREIVPPGQPGDSRLLLVDDDRRLHELLELLLSAEGYRLLHAYSGEEGVETALSQPVSLVILDLLMHGMDGFQVAARLHERPETRHIPVLVLSSKALDEDDRKRLSGTVHALVQKDAASPSELVETIRTLLAGRQAGAAP